MRFEATYTLETVFDRHGTLAERSKVNCLPNATFATAHSMFLSPQPKGVRWYIEPKNGETAYKYEYDDKLPFNAILVPTIYILHSFEPNLILIIANDGPNTIRLVAGPNGIKIGDVLTWSIRNFDHARFGGTEYDFLGYDLDLSEVVREMEQDLITFRAKEAITKKDPKSSSGGHTSSSSQHLTPSSSHSSEKVELYVEHDEESGGVLLEPFGENLEEARGINSGMEAEVFNRHREDLRKQIESEQRETTSTIPWGNSGW